jgi:3-keto-disaccharide hydrolase
MKKTVSSVCAMFSAAALGVTALSVRAAGAPWKQLFNERNFDGWDKFLATPNGDEPLVANVDPKSVFSVTNLNGENVIHVTGEVYGSITTREEFTNFHFRVQFQWGQQRWPGRVNVGRDSGILYCGIGRPNPHTGWLTSVENNVMEKGVGQWWSVNGAIIDVEGEWITPEMELFVPYKKEGRGEKNIVWKRGAPRITALAANGITPPFDVEQVFGNWNTVEVVFWGGQCLHILNGHVNLVAVNPRYKDGDLWRPLTHGKIQLQSESAEVFYRKAEVRHLDELPTEFTREAVSPVGDEQGFAELLNDDTLKDWKQCGPGKFSVANGVASAEGGMGLWWYAARQFTNFVLRGEFVQEQDIADSGVFVRFPNPGNDPWNAVKQGHEFEIGDPNPEKPAWRTGSIYPFKASSKANTRTVNQWNEFEMACIGHDYSVRINGQLVTTWTDSEQRSSTGHIGLQNYNDGKTVRFRNLRVKDLP